MINRAGFLAVSVAVLFVAVTGQRCGPANGTIALAGSETALAIPQFWAEWYMDKCYSINVTLQGGGTSMGAQRVCGNASSGTPVDMGAMSRPWHPTEAISTDGGNGSHKCVIGNTSRQTIQIEVGIEAVAVAVYAGGLAAQCLQKSSGLTVAQLRWMYSNISEAAQGLGLSIPFNQVIPNSDGNETTKNWSELNAACLETNIQIAGDDILSGTKELFRLALGFVAGEGFATNRPGGYRYFNSTKGDDIVKFLGYSSVESYGEAIAFVDMRFYLERGSLLYGVPIRNAAGVYTAPTKASVETNEYNLLSRRLYLQVLNDEASLANTKPFIAWGLSNTVSSELATTSFLALPIEQRAAMLARLELPPPGDEVPNHPASAPVENCNVVAKYSPPEIPVDNCGLLNLNFFCLHGCGFFRRLLGFCDGFVEALVPLDPC